MLLLLHFKAVRAWLFAANTLDFVVPLAVPFVVALVYRVWSVTDEVKSIKTDAAEREQRVTATILSIKGNLAEREQRM